MSAPERIWTSIDRRWYAYLRADLHEAALTEARSARALISKPEERP